MDGWGPFRPRRGPQPVGRVQNGPGRPLAGGDRPVLLRRHRDTQTLGVTAGGRRAGSAGFAGRRGPVMPLSVPAYMLPTRSRTGRGGKEGGGGGRSEAGGARAQKARAVAAPPGGAGGGRRPQRGKFRRHGSRGGNGRRRAVRAGRAAPHQGAQPGDGIAPADGPGARAGVRGGRAGQKGARASGPAFQVHRAAPERRPAHAPDAARIRWPGPVRGRSRGPSFASGGEARWRPSRSSCTPSA